MALSKKKQKTTSNQTATTTPNVPDWILKPYQTSADAVGRFQGQDPMTYAPTSTPELDQVFTGASNLTAPDYGEAKGLLGGVNYDIAPSMASDFTSKYRDLFSKDVIDPVLADYDVNAGKVRASQAADAARNGAFRGSRFGLREAATEGELARGRAATYGGLLKDAANFALTGATGDAGRMQSGLEGNRSARLAGTGLLSDITSRQGSDARATLGVKQGIATQQADLQNRIRQFPLEFQKQLQGLLAGLDPSLFTGQTVNSSGTSTGKVSGSLGDFLSNYLIAGAGKGP